jgi:PPOX class probable F420-dependent enzyme
MRDGTPQSTPVWVDYQDGYVVFNTAEGRQKPRNLRRDPRVSVSIVDRENPRRYVEVRGRVVAMIEEGAAEHLAMLASKYARPGMRLPTRSEEKRLIVKIEPEHVTQMGFDA